MNQPIEAIPRGTTADRVFNILHDWIISGRVKRGEVLPSQDELARQLNVSRNTLREAIFKLSALGLVISRQGVGTVVQPSSPANYISSLPDHLALDQTTFSEFIEARLFAERAIVRLVVARATSGQLSHLEALLNQQQVAMGQGEGQLFSRLDINFHLEMAKTCGNSVMLKFFQSIWELLHRYSKTIHQVPGNIKEAYEGHRILLEAIKARDADQAERLLVSHIREIVRRTLRHLNLDQDPDLVFDRMFLE
jgi:GntR family transcriptional repressor for pyruvate dehydrogenase complex